MNYIANNSFLLSDQKKKKKDKKKLRCLNIRIKTIVPITISRVVLLKRQEIKL